MFLVEYIAVMVKEFVAYLLWEIFTDLKTLLIHYQSSIELSREGDGYICIWDLNIFILLLVNSSVNISQ